jgi:phosphoribosylformimino-5-aminoimidazole carboxamide ribotide isomerase
VLVVPVIDLMGGQVVHARRGDRSNYRPLASALAPSSDPLDVVGGLLAFAPFPVIYAADLDAILHRGGHRDLLLRIAERFPSLTLWVDAGLADPEAAEPWFGAHRLVPVIGSESLASSDALAAMLVARPDAILSLDTRGDQPLGPPALFSQPQRWPERVIVMTLDRVGAGQGPAFARLASLLAQAPGKKLIAAGGVRDARDLDALDAAGIHAVLVASALHDGSLERAALSRFL